ncbi:MAG: LptF/LptG family permease [gamma proteobacterium symbiont of Bathyaustriella thionipta]|nr:LptF/LptG family permease [gamma proteobacterium symbiont of Bathyaustriella thionipta]
MTILDCYIGRIVLQGTLLALFVLMTLIGFILLVDELDKVGEGGYQLLDAIFFVILNLPGIVFQLFPVAAMLGSLVGLGSLASHSELNAMRAAGMSLARITVAVLKTGAILMLLAFLLGELVAPWGERKAQAMRTEKISGTVSMQSQYGFWAKDGNAYINIRKIHAGDRLQGIYI